MCVYVCDFQSQAHSIQLSLPAHKSEPQKGLFPEQKHAPYITSAILAQVKFQKFSRFDYSGGGKGWYDTHFSWISPMAALMLGFHGWLLDMKLYN